MVWDSVSVPVMTPIPKENDRQNLLATYHPT